MAELTVQFAIISPRQYRDQGAAFESFFDNPPTDDCHQHKKQCTYGESLQAFKFASQLDGRFVAEFTTICIAKRKLQMLRLLRLAKLLAMAIAPDLPISLFSLLTDNLPISKQVRLQRFLLMAVAPASRNELLPTDAIVVTYSEVFQKRERPCYEFNSVIVNSEISITGILLLTSKNCSFGRCLLITRAPSLLISLPAESR